MQEGQSLDFVSRLLFADSNWLRLWAVNGNDHGDSSSLTILDPERVQVDPRGSAIMLGNIYTMEKEDTLYSLAASFRTTLKLLLELNPDIREVNASLLGQPVCIVPCTDSYTNS